MKFATACALASAVLFGGLGACGDSSDSAPSDQAGAGGAAAGAGGSGASGGSGGSTGGTGAHAGSGGSTGGTGAHAGSGGSTGGTGASGPSGGSGGSGGSTDGTGASAGASGSCADPTDHTGDATYYDFADGSGNCGFPATPNDLDVGAMNHVDYQGSAACGMCAHVVGPKGEVTVRIVDQCPECLQGAIDLSPQAFGKIAEMSAGRVTIHWRYVPCNVQGPVIYHFKDGANQWWTAVQMRNHRFGIATFEYQDSNGTFQSVPRVDYNYFLASSGMGPGPYTFRVTDVWGHVVQDSGIGLHADTDVSGQGQFPACGN
jgi:expansin